VKCARAVGAKGKLPLLIYAYKTMQQRWRKYYAKEKMPIGEEYTFEKEFEVWARMIKDGNGDDVQMFRKEDKRNGFTKDSLFYYNGYWEVLETDERALTIKSRTSLGVTTVSSHDYKWRVTSNIMTNKYNDTITHDIYFWENGRLVKTIFDGMERIFVYGKTLRDMVKVIPPDDGLYFHSGYNNTAGMIPDENDPEYFFFAKSPYSVYFTQRGMPVLHRHYEIGPREIDYSYPIPVYEYPILKDNLKKDSIYLYGKSSGETRFKPNIISECPNNNGCFNLGYRPEIVYETIILYQSHLVYDNNKKKWQRYCRTPAQLSDTYDHEKKHVDNARNILMEYSEMTMKYEPSSANSFSTKNECETSAQARKKKFYELWNEWQKREFKHCNGFGNPIAVGEDCKKGRDDPRSPAPSRFELGEPCDDEMY
jgi:hypothetical protein